MPRVFAILLLCSMGLACAKREPAVAPPPVVVPEPTPPPAEPVSPPIETPAPTPAPTPTPEPAPPEPKPRRGGFVKVLLGPEMTREDWIRSITGEPLVPGGPIVEPTEPRASDGCWVLKARPGRRTADGKPLDGGAVIADWNRTLLAPRSPAHWLLTLHGAENLRGDEVPRSGSTRGVAGRDGALEICPDPPLPDVPQRLAHPALWYRGGLGAFDEQPDGVLAANPGYPEAGPYLERVEVASLPGDVALLFKLGDVHVAVAYGREAAALIAAGPGTVVTTRLPSWDRTYFLWFSPKRRWVNDPRLRLWISGRIDRKEMIRYLFAELGKPAWSLSGGTEPKPQYELQSDRPLADQSVKPRLVLGYDAADPRAVLIATRLRAVLGREGIDLQLAEGPVECDVVLVAHQPATVDRLLGMLGTVWWLGDKEQSGAQELLAAAAEPDPGERARRAAKVESERLADGRIVPLVRLQAYLAHHPQLTGIGVGAPGALRFEQAWWRP